MYIYIYNWKFSLFRLTGLSPCSLVDDCHRFGEIFCILLQNRGNVFLEQAGNLYKTTRPHKPQKKNASNKSPVPFCSVSETPHFDSVST